MQDIDNFFKVKQALFVTGNKRSMYAFYKHFGLDSKMLVNLDSNIESFFKIFDFDSSENIDSKNIQTFLPETLDIQSFFKTAVISNKAQIPHIIKKFLISNALSVMKKKIKHKKNNLSFLSFEDNFLTHLEHSNIFINFFNDLRIHKIPINEQSLKKFSQIDTYGSYEKELEILSELYDIYAKSIPMDCSDGIYSNEISNNYKINLAFLESFCAIHIDLSGFISPLDYEILCNICNTAKDLKIFIHFKTDSYNVDNFKIFSNEIQKDKHYIYHMNDDKLYVKDIESLNLDSIKLYKTYKSFHQAYLAIMLANKWCKQIDNNESSENDYAVIVTNREFVNYLDTLDSYNLFNFAMGIKIETLSEYRVLNEIYESFLQDKATLNLDPIMKFIESNHKLNAQKFLDSINKKNITQIKQLEIIVFTLFKDYNNLCAQMIEILTQLYILQEKNIANLSFSNIFTTFMQEILALSKDDVGGGRIRVMEALEARNLKFKEILIVDFNDAFIPNVNFDDMFLNTNIRKKTSAAFKIKINMPTRKDKEQLFKHHYYSIMRNSATTHISFVENDESLPSSLLYELGVPMHDSTKIENIDEKYEYFDVNSKSAKDLNKKDSTTNDEYVSFSDIKTKFKFSATALDIYNTCKRKFYFYYVENLRVQSDNINLNVGTNIHKMLQKSFEPFINKKLESKHIKEAKARFKNLYNTYLQNEINSTDILEIVKCDNLAYFIESFFDKEAIRVMENDIRILGLESEFLGSINISSEDIKCGGVIDRIEEENNNLVIIEYKSGKNIANYKDKLQMPFYEICLSKPDDIFFVDEKLDSIFKEKYKDKTRKYYYAMLGKFDNLKDFNKLDSKNPNILEDGVKQIVTLLESFGKQNVQTDKKAHCKDCEYATLCGRD